MCSSLMQASYRIMCTTYHVPHVSPANQGSTHLRLCSALSIGNSCGPGRAGSDPSGNASRMSSSPLQATLHVQPQPHLQSARACMLISTPPNLTLCYVPGSGCIHALLLSMHMRMHMQALQLNTHPVVTLGYTCSPHSPLEGLAVNAGRLGRCARQQVQNTTPA